MRATTTRRASARSSIAPGRTLTLTLSLTLAFTACTGRVESSGASQRIREGAGAPSSQPPPPSEDACRTGTFVSDSSRAPRLTHTQWERTVQDLLRLAAPSNLSQRFTPDGDLASDLFVDERLWAQYQTAAETLAQQTTADLAALRRVLPAGAPTSGDAGARALITELGRRAYRRPLRADEVDRFLVLFNSAPSMFTGRDAFLAGADLVLRALLQSPGFLYRLELSEARRDGLVWLDPYEVASRLSYAIWNSMPDDALFAAAERGELSGEDGVRTQVTRMLRDPRANEVVQAFHRSMLHLDAVAMIAPDPARIPVFRTSMRESIQQEFSRFIDALVFTERGGYAQLMTANYSFANDDIALIYGLEGTFDRTFRRVTLPPQRAGVLTQSAFLAAHGGAYHPDSIHRGVRMIENILCVDIGNPPNGIPPLPAETRGTTNRQRVAAHTSGTACATCHETHINPLGFAFENFDALGRFRAVEENGLAIDATGAHDVDDHRVTYDGPVDLVRAIAESAQGHRCYVRRWVRALAGRVATPTDECLVRRVGDESRRGLPIVDLIASVLASPELRARP